MEGGSWRPAGQGDTGGEPPAGDWRSQLQPESRQRIVNKIMETLQRHLPIPAPEGLPELKKIAVRFEEKIYTAATSQTEYLRKISLKMLSMETKTQNPQAINPSSMNPAAGNQNNVDAASVGLQSQVGNQGLSLPIVNQSSLQQPHLAQNLTNNTPFASIQVSSGLPAPVPSMSGMPQSTISNGGQPSSLQNMSVISQNSINSGNSLFGATQNNYANAQRQMQGRQQPQSTMLQHHQQSQNSLIYQQQFQQQLLKQKTQHPSLLQPHTQQQLQQQQSLLQQNPLQSSQQPLMQMSSSMPASQTNIQQSQPTMMQTAPQSGLQQNQQNSVQQSIPSLLQQNSTSVVRQQLGQPTIHQQSTPLQQQAFLVAQKMFAQRQQLLGQQTNMSSMQQNQLHGKQNRVSDLQQQQQRLSGQQNNLLNMQQSQCLLNQQFMSLGQYLSLHQQQQQLLGNQPDISNMQPHQRPGQILQQNKTAAQQQTQQSSLAMLQSQSLQSQHQSSQQQLMPWIQTQPGQLQQLGMQQQANPLQREMQQRYQASGALIQSQNAIDQQKQVIQSQRLPEVSSSTSLDSTAQTGNVGVVDWQEEIYQKIKAMKELYFAELNEIYQKVSLKLQQCENQNLLSHGKQSEQIEKMKNFKIMLERSIAFLQLSKSSIEPGLKEKLPLYQKQISAFLQQASASYVFLGSMPLSTPAQQTISNTLQSSPIVYPIQGSSFGSLRPASISSVQQSAVGALQNAINAPWHTGMNSLPQSSSVNSLQTNSNTLQQQLIKLQKPQQQLMQKSRSMSAIKVFSLLLLLLLLLLLSFEGWFIRWWCHEVAKSI